MGPTATNTNVTAPINLPLQTNPVATSFAGIPGKFYQPCLAYDEVPTNDVFCVSALGSEPCAMFP